MHEREGKFDLLPPPPPPPPALFETQIHLVLRSLPTHVQSFIPFPRVDRRKPYLYVRTCDTYICCVQALV